jgi:naphthoate synthase
VEWQQQGTWTDICYETAEGIAKITIRRPEVRNAFRPKTLFELQDAFELARDDPAIGVIILTGEGPTPSAPAATSASAATTATSTSAASAA